MRILVCGGRDFGDIPKQGPNSLVTLEYIGQKRKEYQFVFNKLEELARTYSIYCRIDDNWLPTDIEIISGMAKGVDTIAIDWAITNWCKWHEYPADWGLYGKAAGYIRNRRMLDEGKPDLVVAFPGGRGTAMMVKLARDNGTKVVEFKYDMPKVQ